jgi:hypothetical protein
VLYLEVEEEQTQDAERKSKTGDGPVISTRLLQAVCAGQLVDRRTYRPWAVQQVPQSRSAEMTTTVAAGNTCSSQ